MSDLDPAALESEIYLISYEQLRRGTTPGTHTSQRTDVFLLLSRFPAASGEGVLRLSGGGCLWRSVRCVSLNVPRQEVLVFDSTGGRPCFHVRVLPLHPSSRHRSKTHFLSPQELEREITFQAGSGLYYYYYKQLLAAPSFERGSSHFCFLPRTEHVTSDFTLFLFFGSPGFYELIIDNRTVSGQTINAVERLSLYPELITSFVYRVTGSQVGPLAFNWNVSQ